MGDFYRQSFEARYGSMGDAAEQKFTEIHDKGLAVWGLRRPPIRVANVPTKMRYAPDFITSDGFVEVMGVGRGQLLKLKVEKHIALLQWQQEWDTQLFLWDSSKHRYTYIGMRDLTQAIGRGKPGCFPEGKATWEIPVKELGASWVNV